MLENKNNVDVEIGSEKSFGLVFTAVFSLIGIVSIFKQGIAVYWALPIALCFLFVTLISPRLLVLPNKLWFKLGIAIGAIAAPIVMAILYFLAVVPTGIIMQLLGKDILKQKFEPEEQSYWIERTSPVGSMKDQF